MNRSLCRRFLPQILVSFPKAYSRFPFMVMVTSTPLFPASAGVPRRSDVVGGAPDKAQRGAGCLGRRPEEMVVPGRHFLRLSRHQAAAALRICGTDDNDLTRGGLVQCSLSLIGRRRGCGLRWVDLFRLSGLASRTVCPISHGRVEHTSMCRRISGWVV